MAIVGFELVVPSSVTINSGGGSQSITLAPSGKVTFTDVTDVDINGVFTTTYDNYVVMMRYNSTPNVSTNLYFQLLVAGTGSGSYDVQFLYAPPSVSAAQYTSQADARFGRISSSGMNGGRFQFLGPNLAKETSMRSMTTGAYLGGEIYDSVASETGTTQFDGFNFRPGAPGGTQQYLTGALCVYGYVK